MSQWMDPNEENFIGEAVVDLADCLINHGGFYTYALNEKARSLVVEIDVDNNQNSNGGVWLYVNGSTSGIYWRRVVAGRLRVMAMPSTKIVTIVPFPGSQGLLRIQMCKGSLAPAVYSL